MSEWKIYHYFVQISKAIQLLNSKNVTLHNLDIHNIKI